MIGWGTWVAAVALLQAAPVVAPAEKPKDKGGTPVDELVVTAPSQKPELKLNFDLRGDFGPRSDQPYLRQRPVNGCKPMAGGATHPLNKSGVASGIVCAKRF